MPLRRPICSRLRLHLGDELLECLVVRGLLRGSHSVSQKSVPGTERGVRFPDYDHSVRIMGHAPAGEHAHYGTKCVVKKSTRTLKVAQSSKAMKTLLLLLLLLY